LLFGVLGFQLPNHLVAEEIHASGTYPVATAISDPAIPLGDQAAGAYHGG
jgi:hypothetical protein